MLSLAGCSKSLLDNIIINKIAVGEPDKNSIVFFVTDITEDKLLVFSDYGISGPDSLLESGIYIDPDTSYTINRFSQNFNEWQTFYRNKVLIPYLEFQQEKKKTIEEQKPRLTM